ncbi:substrate-binding periplasmic protein [Tistlia consotensis]|nr:transporter substrate-binding domain-containing protein [Tistlia consotensis]
MLRRAALTGLAFLSVGLIAAATSAAADEGFGQGSNPGAPTQVRLVYEVDPNPPRTLGTGTAVDWSKPGLTLELLRLVGKRLDVDFVFQRVPWKRGLFMVQHGFADGLFHTSYVAEREPLLTYPRRPDGSIDDSRQIFSQSYVLYVKKGSPLRWDGKAFEALDGPVGAVASYAVADDLRRLGVQVEEERSTIINLRKLIEGRIAADAELQTMADPEIRRHPEIAVQIEKLEPPLRTKPYFLTFSHQFQDAAPALAERIWDAIASVNASPEFKAIVETYE